MFPLSAPALQSMAGCTYERGELPNASSLLSKDLLGVGSPDDDLSAGVGDTDLTSGVALGAQAPGEELGELGAADGRGRRGEEVGS